MGRKNSLAKNSIQMLCVMQHLDEQNLYERSKLLLSIYRNVWKRDMPLQVRSIEAFMKL